jgi:nucleoside diphosphate kinase
MQAEILKAFEKVTAKDAAETHAWIKPYEAAKDADAHQFLLFLKPEVTATYDGVKLDKILDLVFKALAQFEVEIGAARILTGQYLDKHDLMVQHYGVISAISKRGVSAISDVAKKNLEEKFKADLEAGAPVLGGNQFLEQEKGFNAFSLSVLNDNLGTTRLAGGTYAMRIKVMGKPVIILNPFHAYQLVPYTTHGHAIIALEGRSKRSWAELRSKLIGVTDPKEAAAGSIRNQLLQQKEELGLKDVDKGTNGIHMSAGPLEGMVELRRFFSDHEAGKELTYEEIAFGQLLGADQANKLAANPDLDQEGKKVSAFDATEESDAKPAAELLKGAKLAAL